MQYFFFFFLYFFFPIRLFIPRTLTFKGQQGKGEAIVFFGIASTQSRISRHLIAFLSLRFTFNYQLIRRRDQYPKFKFINLIFQLKQLSFLNIVALETASKNVTVAVHGISEERNTKGIQNFIPLNYCEEPIFHELLYLLIY